MLKGLARFLWWGPHGLYGTLALLAFSVPAGFAYAYVAHAGYKKTGITRPSAERRRAAVGGAIITAIVIVFFRHLVGADLKEVMNGAMNGTLAAIMAPANAIDRFVASQIEHAQNDFARLFWAIASIAVIPASVGVALIGALIAGAVTGVGFLALMVSGASAVGAAVVAAIIALPGFLLGVPVLFYLYFVRLPLQVVFARARRGGRWPTAAELSDAVVRGTTEKSAWQSEIMEYKSRKFQDRVEHEAQELRKKGTG